MFSSQLELSKWKKILEIFIPSWLPENTKPKIYDKIREQYLTTEKGKDIYDIQLLAIANIKEIEVCHLLGRNEIVIPQLVAAYKDLYNNIENLFTRIEKLNFPEIKTQEKVFKETLKLKNIKDFLYKDLETFSTKFPLEHEIKHYIQLR